MPVRVGVASGRELGGTRGRGLAVESEGTDGNTCGVVCAAAMFALLFTMLDDVNTINTWAEPHSANGVTPNTVIDSNDEPAGNNQQRMVARGY